MNVINRYGISKLSNCSMVVANVENEFKATLKNSEKFLVLDMFTCDVNVKTFDEVANNKDLPVNMMQTDRTILGKTYYPEIAEDGRILSDGVVIAARVRYESKDMCLVYKPSLGFIEVDSDSAWLKEQYDDGIMGNVLEYSDDSIKRSNRDALRWIGGYHLKHKVPTLSVLNGKYITNKDFKESKFMQIKFKGLPVLDEERSKYVEGIEKLNKSINGDRSLHIIYSQDSVSEHKDIMLRDVTNGVLECNILSIDGIAGISSRCFRKIRCNKLNIGEGLVYIGEKAFENIETDYVILPSSLKYLCGDNFINVKCNRSSGDKKPELVIKSRDLLFGDMNLMGFSRVYVPFGSKTEERIKERFPYIKLHDVKEFEAY